MIFFTLVSQAIKAKRVQWLIYSAIGIGLILLYMSVFPSIQSQAHLYDSLYASLPKGLIAAFNISNVAPTLMGFLSSKHFGLVWLMMIILLSISYSSFAIGKEIETKTMGFLLAQPIRRTQLYFARLSAGIIGLTIFVVVSELIVWPLAKVYGYAADAQSVILVGIAGFLFGLSVLCLGLMFSAMSNTSGRVSAYTGGILALMYALFLTSTLNVDLDGLKYVSLFHYFAPGDIVTTSTISITSVIIFSTFSIITTVVGALVFRKRQIQV